MEEPVSPVAPATATLMLPIMTDWLSVFASVSAGVRYGGIIRVEARCRRQAVTCVKVGIL
jgi:hypothetical protein